MQRGKRVKGQKWAKSKSSPVKIISRSTNVDEHTILNISQLSIVDDSFNSSSQSAVQC